MLTDWRENMYTHLKKTLNSCARNWNYRYRKVPTSFQSYPENSNNKTNLGKYFFQNWREPLLNVLASSQTICLANLDVATDLATSQSSERIDFYCDHKEADTKLFTYIVPFVIIFV